MAPQFIYFDLDDTLLDHRHAERCAIADLYETHAEHLGTWALDHIQETYHQVNTVLWRRYAAGEVDKATVRWQRFQNLFDALPLTTLESRPFSEAYLACYAHHWAYCSGAEAAFFALAKRFPVGVLTNGFSEIQHAKLARFPGLRDRLDALVISDEVGYLKPHPQLFAHATEAAGVPPEAILYIGDSYHSDVLGATRAGWQIAWYNDWPEERVPEEARNVFRFHDWQALLDRLEPPAV